LNDRASPPRSRSFSACSRASSFPRATASATRVSSASGRSASVLASRPTARPIIAVTIAATTSVIFSVRSVLSSLSSGCHSKNASPGRVIGTPTASTCCPFTVIRRCWVLPARTFAIRSAGRSAGFPVREYHLSL
jgi:hypothetical protein